MSQFVLHPIFSILVKKNNVFTIYPTWLMLILTMNEEISSSSSSLWPLFCHMHGDNIRVFMIEQLWWLYRFFFLLFSDDELVSIKWGAKNKREQEKKNSREKFLFFCFPFPAVFPSRREKKEYARCSSFILVLSICLFLDIYLRCCYYSLSCIYNITLHHHTYRHIFFLLLFIFSGGFSPFAVNMLNVIFCKFVSCCCYVINKTKKK
jgi:hypothetical protein